MHTNTQTFVSELTPGTLEKKGVAYAPRTLASLVYMEDGTPVSDMLKEMISNGKRFILRTKTEQIEASFDNQRIYEIPTPLERYNFDKFPLIVSINNVLVEPSNYIINGTQLILTQELSVNVRQNDIITFIFHYLDIIIEDSGLNAEYINNVRFYVSDKEPRHKKTSDVWFDTTLNQVKQFKGEEWKIIVSGGGSNTPSNPNTPTIPSGPSLSVAKSTYTLNSNSPTVNIGISDYNKKRDILFVYLNSTYLEEGQDYMIENNRLIRNIHGNWDGREEPQLFNFVIIKNIAYAFDGNGNPLSVSKSNAIVNSQTTTVNIGISDYNKKRDILFVYLNSTYLEEGQDYTIKDTKITCSNGNWDGREEPQLFNFIVFKNVIQTSDPISNEMLDNIITQNEPSSIVKNDSLNYDEGYISQLFNIIKDCQSTITILSKKIEVLEELVQK